jgi:hypothetical protein
VFHDLGVMSALIFGIPAAAGAMLVAFLVWRNRVLPLGNGTQVSARFMTPYVAAVALMFIGLLGCIQLPAYSLSRQLAAGGATVTEGAVYSTATGRGWECFSIGDHRYCYGNSLFEVGFHQTAASGGPIRDGLQVRVSSIGDVIVRLEIADGQ